MNVYKKGAIRIDYNGFLDRLCVVKNDQNWISISQVVFEIWISLFKAESIYERVIVRQNAADVEIIKLETACQLTYISKHFQSGVTFSTEELKSIHENLDMIRSTLFNYRMTRRFNVTNNRPASESRPWRRNKNYSKAPENAAEPTSTKPGEEEQHRMQEG